MFDYKSKDKKDCSQNELFYGKLAFFFLTFAVFVIVVVIVTV